EDDDYDDDDEDWSSLYDGGKSLRKAMDRCKSDSEDEDDVYLPDGFFPPDAHLPRYLHDALLTSNPRWARYKVFPSSKAPTKSLSGQTQYNWHRQFQEGFGLHIATPTHAGRHSASREARNLNIGQAEISHALRNQRNSLPLPSSQFALAMGGHWTGRSTCFELPRGELTPGCDLQRLVFPWIEQVIGEPYSVERYWWELECKDEMEEIDEDSSTFSFYQDVHAKRARAIQARIDEDLEAAKLAKRQTTQQRKLVQPKDLSRIRLSAEKDRFKMCFLRLLVRCRRIILQDAAVLLWKATTEDQIAPILEDELFKHPAFLAFQKDLIQHMLAKESQATRGGLLGTTNQGNTKHSSTSSSSSGVHMDSQNHHEQEQMDDMREQMHDMREQMHAMREQQLAIEQVAIKHRDLNQRLTHLALELERSQNEQNGTTTALTMSRLAEAMSEAQRLNDELQRITHAPPLFPQPLSTGQNGQDGAALSTQPSNLSMPSILPMPNIPNMPTTPGPSVCPPSSSNVASQPSPTAAKPKVAKRKRQGNKKK
ncbi:hypothetical protein DFQ26_004376, partial [Actinomortierella ambigua]